MNSLTKKIIVSAVAVLILGCIGYLGYSSYKSNQMEKKFEARVNQGVDLYNSIKEANKIIDQHHQAYINKMTEAVDNGTYTEETETHAFNTMYKTSDCEINAINCDALCDSLNKLCLNKYEFNDDYRAKIEELENLMSKLISCGYVAGGFSTRSDKWKNDPWYSLNSPYYHSFKMMKDNANELDKLGNELNKFKPETHKPNNKSGDIDNIVNQAIKYYNGTGGQQNTAKAIELFTKAAQSGHAHSMYNLGVILEDSDRASADKWYRKAAICGDTKAMIEFASRNYRLHPSFQNISDGQRALAKKWYERAANYGNTDGLFYMGLYYILWGGDKAADNDKAARYFQIGSICGDARCTNNYANLQTSPAEQAKYYRLALQQDPNYTPARDNLRRLGY